MKTWAKTLRELAAAVESDHSTLIAWREKGCPIKETGRGYYIPKVRKWIEENPRRRKEAKLTSTKMRDRQELADVRVKEARAKKAELEYEIKLGKFMELEKVKQRDLARIRAVKDGLMSLPKTLAPIVVEGFADQFQAEAVLEKKVTELLEKFSSM